MLLSVEKNFLFVHVPKTGGTSIRRILQPYCVARTQTRYRGLLSHIPVPENPDKAWLRLHDTAYWARLKLPRPLFDDLFKFAVVRNPFDYAVSYFEFQTRSYTNLNENERRDAFLSYLKRMKRRGFIKDTTQSHWLTDWHGRLIVDQVLRFERLDDELPRLLARFGIISDNPLPRENPSKRGAVGEYYTDEAVELVQHMFRNDFDLFSYDRCILTKE